MTEQQYSDLKALVNSPGWRQVSEYIEKQIKSLQVNLEWQQFESLSQVSLIQGKLQAFRAVLAYPGTRCEAWEKKQEG